MLLHKYSNGNCDIELYDDGTRILTAYNEIKLDYPLNIDIRVSTKCPYGYNEKTNMAKCSFCHESATTNGNECDYDRLYNILSPLPSGIELAIGVNYLSKPLEKFLNRIKNKFVVNITVNSYYLSKQNSVDTILRWVDEKLIHGLGVSYRKNTKIPKEIIDYDNMVLHVINGIDNIKDVYDFVFVNNIKKILILGEKDFGFNKNNVNLKSFEHMMWRKHWKKFVSLCTTSFDNLALVQLDVENSGIISKDDYDIFNQGEHSMYINAVDGYYSPSSRSIIKQKINDMSIKDFFIYSEKSNKD